MIKLRKKLFIVSLVCLAVLAGINFCYAEKLPNPLGDNLTDPSVLIGNIINALLGIVGSVALGVFVLGGFYWITSAGSDEKIKKGKDMIIWASLGLAVIFMSYALVTFVIGAITGGAGSADSGGITEGEGPEVMPGDGQPVESN